MTDAQRRIELTLVQTCTVTREEVTPAENLDMLLDTPEVVVETACLLLPLEASTDVTVLGSLPNQRARVLLQLDTDVQTNDALTIEGDTWRVTDPVVLQYHRGIATHLETVVQRELVQA